jgi:ComF family protein
MRAACVYDATSRNIMLPFKHAGALHFQKIMSRAMIAVLHELPDDIDLVIPVPLANRRLFHRGYNQAALLARPIARHLGVKMDLDSVSRKYRPDMGHKNEKQRRANIRGVFSVKNKNAIAGKNILLVDDVMTTGATFSELYRILRRAGAGNIYGVAFCRVARAI